jgi:hypothetical protein
MRAVREDSVKQDDKSQPQILLPRVAMGVLVPVVLAMDVIVATTVWYVVGYLLR